MSDALKTPSKVRAPSDAPSSSSRHNGLPLKSPAHASVHATPSTPSSALKSKPMTPMEEIKIKGSVLANATAPWETRTTALIALASLVSSEEFAALRQDEIKYARAIDALQTHVFTRIPAQIMDLRAQVCRDACKMVSEMASVLGDDAKGLVQECVPALLKTLTVSKKVMVNFADQTMLSLLKSCDMSLLVAEVIGASNDKNQVLRERCCHYLLVGLRKHSVEQFEEPNMMLEEILKVIKESIADCKGEVREMAFSCLCVIETKWPSKYQEIIDTMDPTAAKQLAALKAKKKGPGSAPSAAPRTFVRPSSFVRNNVAPKMNTEDGNKTETQEKPEPIVEKETPAPTAPQEPAAPVEDATQLEQPIKEMTIESEKAEALLPIIESDSPLLAAIMTPVKSEPIENTTETTTENTQSSEPELQSNEAKTDDLLFTPLKAAPVAPTALPSMDSPLFQMPQAPFAMDSDMLISSTPLKPTQFAGAASPSVATPAAPSLNTNASSRMSLLFSPAAIELTAPSVAVETSEIPAFSLLQPVQVDVLECAKIALENLEIAGEEENEDEEPIEVIEEKVEVVAPQVEQMEQMPAESVDQMTVDEIEKDVAQETPLEVEIAQEKVEALEAPALVQMDDEKVEDQIETIVEEELVPVEEIAMDHEVKMLDASFQLPMDTPLKSNVAVESAPKSLIDCSMMEFDGEDEKDVTMTFRFATDGSNLLGDFTMAMDTKPQGESVMSTPARRANAMVADWGLTAVPMDLLSAVEEPAEITSEAPQQVAEAMVEIQELTIAAEEDKTQNENVSEIVVEAEQQVDEVIGENVVIAQEESIEKEEEMVEQEVQEEVMETTETPVAPTTPACTSISGALRVVMQQQDGILDENAVEVMREEETNDLAMSELDMYTMGCRPMSYRKTSLSTIDEMSEPAYSPLSSPTSIGNLSRRRGLSMLLSPHNSLVSSENIIQEQEEEDEDSVAEQETMPLEEGETIMSIALALSGVNIVPTVEAQEIGKVDEIEDGEALEAETAAPPSPPSPARIQDATAMTSPEKQQDTLDASLSGIATPVHPSVSMEMGPSTAAARTSLMSQFQTEFEAQLFDQEVLDISGELEDNEQDAQYIKEFELCLQQTASDDADIPTVDESNDDAIVSEAMEPAAIEEEKTENDVEIVEPEAIVQEEIVEDNVQETVEIEKMEETVEQESNEEETKEITEIQDLAPAAVDESSVEPSPIVEDDAPIEELEIAEEMQVDPIAVEKAEVEIETAVPEPTVDETEDIADEKEDTLVEDKNESPIVEQEVNQAEKSEDVVEAELEASTPADEVIETVEEGTHDEEQSAEIMDEQVAEEADAKESVVDEESTADMEVESNESMDVEQVDEKASESDEKEEKEAEVEEVESEIAVEAVDEVESEASATEEEEDEEVIVPKKSAAKRTTTKRVAAKRTSTRATRAAAKAVVVEVVEDEVSEDVDEDASVSEAEEASDVEEVVEAPKRVTRGRAAAKKTVARGGRRKAEVVEEDAKEQAEETNVKEEAAPEPVLTRRASTRGRKMVVPEPEIEVEAPIEESKEEEVQEEVKTRAKRGAAKRTAKASTAAKSKKATAAAVIVDDIESESDEEEPVEEEPARPTRRAAKRTAKASSAKKKTAAVVEVEDEESSNEEEEEQTQDENVSTNVRAKSSAASKKAAAKKTNVVVQVEVEEKPEEEPNVIAKKTRAGTRAKATSRTPAPAAPAAEPAKPAKKGAAAKKMPLQEVNANKPSTPIANRVRARAARG